MQDDDIRIALATKLLADSTLVSYLGSGVQGMYNDRDFSALNNPTYPIVVVAFGGSNPYSGADIYQESWHFRVYDILAGYSNINLICERIKELLHNKEVSVTNAGSPRYILNCLWSWKSPNFYDEDLHANFVVTRFSVLVRSNEFMT